MAMRAMSEAPAGASIDEEMPNVLYSPSGSATTGFSAGSSLGLPYKGAWCTPPRVFVDYQVSFTFPRTLSTSVYMSFPLSFYSVFCYAGLILVIYVTG